jgi:hypothetical protein
MNPLALKAALEEVEVQLKMMSSRAQQLAVELAQERGLHAATRTELKAAQDEVEKLKSDGTPPEA